MSNGKQCLDPTQLKQFLDEQLDEREESTILSHIDNCDVCQQALEGIAAGKKTWIDLKNQLADHLDLDVTNETAPYQVKDRDVEMEKLKEYLGPTDDPNMLGRLGSYEVCGLVGRGSTGVVVKALDTRLNRFVAIKVLSPSFSSNGPARTRFEREGRSIAAVSHEHVVPIHSVNEYRGLPFIVMHYVDGGSLHQRIEKNGPLETCEVVRIGMQIARGLAAAHGQGIIHRDVKPANVMLESGVDRAMVSDFGLARVADEAAMTRSGVIAGTPQYMSPEQAMGDPIDPRSDLFSLGSVLYTACTGRAPFRSETVFGVIKRVCESKPRPIREINPSIAPWLDALISKLQEKDREDRFESAEQVANLLNEELAHLQSPSFVPEPERPWMTVVAPTPPVKEKERGGMHWAQMAVTSCVAIATVLVIMATNGMLQFASIEQQPVETTALDQNYAAFAVDPTIESAVLPRPNEDADAEAALIAASKMKKWSAKKSKFVPNVMHEVEVAILSDNIVKVDLESGSCADEKVCEGCTGDCESECEECESCNQTSYEVVDGDTGIPGRLVAVEKDYSGGIVDGYLMYLPVSYQSTSRSYPVIMFLTGGCGVGGDVADLKCWCLPRSIQNQLKKGDVDLEDEHQKLMMDSFIVVAPHMRAGSFESRQFFDQESAVTEILEEIESKYRVDSRRVYLTGSGRGGHGTWGLASRMASRFAAIAPIRGMRFGIQDYQALSKIPVWIGHNAKDDEIEFSETKEVISRLEKIDGQDFYVIEEADASKTPYLEHDRILTSKNVRNWPDLYASAPLYKWFLHHERKPSTDVVHLTQSEEDTSGTITHAIVTSMMPDATEFTSISKPSSLNKPTSEKAKVLAEALEEFESNVEKLIKVESGGKLLIRTDLGHVKLKTIDQDEVQFTLRRKLAAESEELANEVFASQEIDFNLERHELEAGKDAAIVIEIDKETENVDWKNGGVQYRVMELEVGIPDEFNVDVATAAGHITSPDIDGDALLKTSGGHIELKGCSRTAKLKTSGGHLTIGDVAGNLVAKTSGGHIVVSNVAGNAKLDTSGGNIELSNSSGSVDARTSGGNIDVVISGQPRQDMVLMTSAGNLKVGLHREIKVDIKASCHGGNISGDVVADADKNPVRISVNGGGPKIKAESTVGNIKLYYIETEESATDL